MMKEIQQVNHPLRNMIKAFLLTELSVFHKASFDVLEKPSLQRSFTAKHSYWSVRYWYWCILWLNHRSIEGAENICHFLNIEDCWYRSSKPLLDISLSIVPGSLTHWGNPFHWHLPYSILQISRIVKLPVLQFCCQANPSKAMLDSPW